jgi:predicted XRE-type DNA-binding protein
MPADVRHEAGYQLSKIQSGQQPDDFKPMPAVEPGFSTKLAPIASSTLLAAGGCFRIARVSEEDPGDAASRHRIGEGAISGTDEGSEMNETQTFASVWDAVADTPAEAANLRARAELMQEIANIVKESGWTQAEAAAKCGVTQPRINDLLRGRVSRFSLDALVNVATALGRRVRVEIGVA